MLKEITAIVLESIW